LEFVALNTSANKSANTPAPNPSIPTIFFVFFRIGLFSFGGGLSGWMFREIVTSRQWMDEDEFLSGLAVSQILPGTNVSNLAVFVGNRLKGLVGSVVALAGLLTGPFFAVIAMASVYAAFKTLPFAEAGLDGLTAAAIGLILIVAMKGARRAVPRIEALLALLVTFVAVGLLHWSLLAVVVVVGPLSVAAAWARLRADA
jgi:chromate transporter